MKRRTPLLMPDVRKHRLQGGALDAEGERAALQRGWRR